MAKTVDQYIRSAPKKVQPILRKVRASIRKASPKASEMIAYGMPAYKLNGKPLVYFGIWKNHIGFYATPSGHSAFKKELAKYANAKGSVKFPLDKPVPFGLIGRMVRFKVKENAAKK